MLQQQSNRRRHSIVPSQGALIKAQCQNRTLGTPESMLIHRHRRRRVKLQPPPIGGGPKWQLAAQLPAPSRNRVITWSRDLCALVDDVCVTLTNQVPLLL